MISRYKINCNTNKNKILYLKLKFIIKPLIKSNITENIPFYILTVLIFS